MAESALTKVCEDLDLNYKPGYDEAAFYGPKLDFMFNDAIGREWQLATVQCDFNAPERFDMSYTNEEGKPERPVVIHRAIAGSLERFLGVAIEHFAGAFPVWLSPVQVAILPVSEKFADYAAVVKQSLEEAGVRLILDSDDSLGKRIRNTKTEKIPYQIIIGEKEVSSQTLTVEGRNDLKLEGITPADFTARISDEIKNRTNN
jgi:threonyl-tRNA synthetase